MSDEITQVESGDPGQTPEVEVVGGTSGLDHTSVPETPTPSNFKERIPEQYREAGYWKNVDSEDALFRQFDELQKYRGGSIKVPREGEGQAAWDSIYDKLGRPETPEGYDIHLRDHDGKIQWADESEPFLRNMAHELGLNSKQAQLLGDKYGELILAENAKFMQARQAQLNELQDSYGDLFERKLTLGERAIHKVGGEEMVDYIKSKGWDTDPMMVKLMINVGGLFEESNLIDGRVGAMGRSEAQAKLDAIYNDMSHPYWNDNDPGHDAAIKEVMNFEDIVYRG